MTGHVDRNALRQTHWLSHLTNILDGVLIIVRTVHLYNSHVLVHCSDGWDRTSQLSALPQLCLDPYYRTAEGFAVLIEKDWVSYGHRFTDRGGHICGDRVQFVSERGEEQTAQRAFLASVTKQFSGSSHAFKETCPVFQQYLDCTYQLLRQFSNRFEFNEKFLLDLQHETYAGDTGTFLFNSEKDRRQYRARERTRSVWERMFEEVDGTDGQSVLRLREQYRSMNYDKSLDDPASKQLGADQGVLFVDPQDVRWWYRLFGRGDEEMNGQPMQQLSPSEYTVTEVSVVESAEDDPVYSALAGDMSKLGVSRASAELGAVSSAMSHPQDRYRSLSPKPDRSASPLAARLEVPTQAQLSEAVSSVQKFGWSAWKAVQKYSQEAASRYSETASGRAEDSRVAGSSELDGGSQGARLPPTSNPWGSARTNAAPPINSTSLLSDTSPASATYAVYKASAPKQSVDPLGANPWAVRDETGAQRPVEPNVGPASVPSSSPSAAADQTPRTVIASNESGHEANGNSSDPLGVGFSS